MPVESFRAHTDSSILYRYFNDPMNTCIIKAAFSLTGDGGFELG